MVDFVDGWSLCHTLGEGAYGEVKLVINNVTAEAVAMKIINRKKHADADVSCRKETAIQKILNHPHIIKYFGSRNEVEKSYIFLEYASGGELFDRIEPDVGMPFWEAHKYFKQLISAVEYMHNLGVAHRDLKPENLLLDSKDNLKVTDFGLATIFRAKGNERLLDTRCGTLPYVAPEVLEGKYRAQPADIWSCGLILVAMLAGELPWDQAEAEYPEYAAWISGHYMSLTPWKKLDNMSIAFARKILTHSADERYRMEDIKRHRWYIERPNEGKLDEPDGQYKKRPHLERNESLVVCMSQPVIMRGENVNHLNLKLEDRPIISFSQPNHMDDLLLGSQLQALTQQSSQNAHQKLVKRMTRFFVECGIESTIKTIIKYMEQENYTCRVNHACEITTMTVDKRKTPLVFKTCILEMNGKVLVDFRLSKGCGLEFKRKFIKIKKGLDHIIMKNADPSWSL